MQEQLILDTSPGSYYVDYNLVLKLTRHKKKCMTTQYTRRKAELDYLKLYIAYPELLLTNQQISDDLDNRRTRHRHTPHTFNRISITLVLLRSLEEYTIEAILGYPTDDRRSEARAYFRSQNYHCPSEINFEKQLLRIERRNFYEKA